MMSCIAFSIELIYYATWYTFSCSWDGEINKRLQSIGNKAKMGIIKLNSPRSIRSYEWID
jgi:hypothetical protein